MDQWVSELDQNNIDISALQETKKKGKARISMRIVG